MVLKSLNKLRLPKKISTEKKPQPPQEPDEETVTTYSTLSLEDSAKYSHSTSSESDVGYEPQPQATEDIEKYGYNTYDDVKQESNTEDDASKYGYNTYDDVEQDEPKTPPVSRRCSVVYPHTVGSSGPSQSPYKHCGQRMPRRSSLKGSNPSTPRQLRRNSLSFSNSVTVTHITPTQELAKKKSSLWFEDKDYERMYRKIHLIVDRARKEDGTRLCTRGLESVIRDDGETKTRRYAAWDAVLDEQERQAANNHYDVGAVSNSYREVSENSRFEATIRGLKDQQAVKGYLSDTRKYCRRMSM